jgi:hypothetical protein
MRNRWMLVVPILGILVCSAPVGLAQCDGLQYAGQAYGQCSYGSNYYGIGEVLLPPNIKLNTSCHQTANPTHTGSVGYKHKHHHAV